MLGCRTRRRRKAERPSEILDAAFEEFALHGFAGTRLDDIATRAGVTKGTIYLYFDSKEDLFIAALKEMTSPAFEHLKLLMETPQQPAAVILHNHLIFVAEQTMTDRRTRQIIRMLMADGPRFPRLIDRWHRDVIAPACDAFRAVIAYGVDRGEFRRSAVADFPQVILAPIILANVWMSIFEDRHPLDLKRFFAAAVDALVQGLVAKSDQPRRALEPVAKSES